MSCALNGKQHSVSVENCTMALLGFMSFNNANSIEIKKEETRRNTFCLKSDFSINTSERTPVELESQTDSQSDSSINIRLASSDYDSNRREGIKR